MCFSVHTGFGNNKTAAAHTDFRFSVHWCSSILHCCLLFSDLSNLKGIKNNVKF